VHLPWNQSLPKAAIIRTGRRRILELSKIVLYLADATYIGLGVGCICALVRADQSTSLNHRRNLSENYASGYPDSISFWQHWSNFEDAYLKAEGIDTLESSLRRWGSQLLKISLFSFCHVLALVPPSLSLQLAKIRMTHPVCGNGSNTEYNIHRYTSSHRPCGKSDVEYSSTTRTVS
jgi:hypothetical protein